LSTSVWSGRHARGLLGLLVAVVAALSWLGSPGDVAAHAEPVRAEPPINGTVPVAPERVEIWFSEEINASGTAIQVIGPGGIQVDLGDTTLDLMDPNRQHVTISLRSNLGPGAYTVQWQSLSATDGDSTQGGFLFRVEAGTPSASPVASPVGAEPASRSAEATPAQQEAVPTATVEVVTAESEDDFDSQAFGISVLAGLVAAVLIFVFWRIVRPKNPKF
jgi:methionine-rich copper-binding protein CopC